MLLPGTNSDGILVLAVGLGVAFAIEAFSPIKNDGPLTIVLGVGVAVLGFALRHQENPEDTSQTLPGPKVLFLPAWIIGLLWVALGVAKWVGVVA